MATSRPSGFHAPGTALDAGVRADLETSFQVDLAGVRQHTGPRAEAFLAARRLRAAAVGQHVVLPARRPGRDDDWWRLLAHEVAHSVQQAQGHRGAGGAWEAQAHAAADAVAAGRTFFRTGLEPPSAGRGAAVLAGYNSWEHRLLGDLNRDELVMVAGRSGTWRDVVARQVSLMALWKDGVPAAVTRGQILAIDPAVTVVRLNDGVVATSGEINAIGDFVANVGGLSSVPTVLMMTYLQSIRQESYNQLSALVDPTWVRVQFPGAVPLYDLLSEARETQWIDAQSSPLGADHYNGLLARNACHFAPYSWFRWLEAHTAARAAALQSFALREGPDGTLANQAWLAQGYADHFLQDSFAPGHLTNKTLVMQWFVQWAQGTWALPILSWDAVSKMVPANEPGLMGRPLYGDGYLGPSNDPQTAEEQANLASRMSATGIQGYGTVSAAQAYQQYLALLQSSVVQLSTKLVHDYFNTNGLAVTSGAHAEKFTTYGDGLLLDGRNQGVAVAGDTMKASRDAITAILQSGQAASSPSDVLAMLPSKVVDRTATLVPLLTWHDGDLKTQVPDIFGAPVARAKYLGLRAFPSLGMVTGDRGGGVGETPAWSTTPSSSQPDNLTSVTPFWDGSRLYVGYRQQVFRLDPAKGTLLDFNTTAYGGTTDVSFASDGTTLFIGKEHYVGALDAADLRTVRWATGYLGNPPNNNNVDLLYADAGHLYAGTEDGYVYDLDPANGQGKDHNWFTGWGYYRPRMALTDAVLVVGIKNQVVGLDRQGISNKLWPVAEIDYPSSSSLVDVLAMGSGVFVGTGQIYALLDAQARTDQDLVVGRGTDATLTGEVRQDCDGAQLYRAGRDSNGDARVTCLSVSALYGLDDGTPATASRWSSVLTASGQRGGTTAVNVLVVGDRLFAAADGLVYELDPAGGQVGPARQPLNGAAGEVRMASDGVRLFCGAVSSTQGQVVAYNLLSTPSSTT